MGLVSLVNLGNSCYINSVLQVRECVDISSCSLVAVVGGAGGMW